MDAAPLACTVRGCGAALTRRDRSYACPHGHSYDVARSGYVNLLQPQDRRSARPGDARPAVESRLALERAGVGRALKAAVIEVVAARVVAGDVVVDLGSGTGDVLEAVCAGRGLVGVGIDLSQAAAAYAARQRPDQTWLIANADRSLPILDGSAAVVLSLHARRNPGEVSRILRPGGCFVAALPAPDDLRELREAMLGTSTARDRTAAVIAEHAERFTLAEQRRVADRARLDRTAVQALRQATYRGARRREAARIEDLDGIDVTIASDLLIFRRRV